MASSTPEQLSPELIAYLRTGKIPDLSEPLDLDFSMLQAVYWRREAIVARNELKDPKPAEYFRQKSREAKRQGVQPTDYSLVSQNLIDNLFNTETNFDVTGQLTQIISFFKQNGFAKNNAEGKTISLPSSIDPRLLAQLQSELAIQLIPIDQIDFTDFKNILHSSEIPAWLIELQQHQADTETIQLFTALKQRWFLFLILMTGMAAIGGTIFDVGIEIGRLSEQFAFFLSVYGMAAIVRNVWQTERAEKWNKRAQSYNREPLIEALKYYIKELDPNDVELAEEAQQILDQNLGWDEFLIKIGFKASKNPNYKSLIDRYIKKLSEFGRVVNRDFILNSIAQKVIDKIIGPNPPTVAVVIPSYQVPPESIRQLLLSVKDQAYPVTTAFVVYNDDPNGSAAKQQEFAQIQAIVNQVNQTQGRNECHAVLLAQPSRGKREAMAMGFAAAMGRGYLGQLRTQYATKFNEYLKQDPTMTQQEKKQAKANFKERLNNMIANLNITELPNFKHDRILNIDSDTQIADPLAVLNSELMKQKHPNAGSITGDVRVQTRDTNLLTDMTYQRYWHAFFKERAAQSETGEVTCMSGPWVYMDSDMLGEILPEWYFFTHVAGRATFGDDREISTRMLEKGHESLFCPDSAVWTDCPDTYKNWLKQQLRWNKSFNIYNMVLFDFLHRLDKFVQMDVVYQQTFPFVLLFIMTKIATEAVNVGLEEGPIAGLKTTIPYALTVLLFNELFFGIYGTLKNRIEQKDGSFRHDYRFLLSPVYVYYHFRYLLWIKLKAFYSLFIQKNTQWGTKGEQFEQAFAEQFQTALPDLVGQVTDEIMHEYEDGQTPREEVKLDENLDVDPTTPIDKIEKDRRRRE